MADEPIRTGAAALSALVDEVGSEISTDDYGIDVGTVTFFCPTQALLTALRPAPGDLYNGGLPQFSGFVCDTASQIGGEGDSGAIRAVYMKINSSIATAKQDLPILSADLDSRAVKISEAVTIQQVSVPNPVLTLRYATATPLTGPSIGTFSYPAGTAPGGSYSITVLWEGINYELSFTPNQDGYLFASFDAEPLCGGAIYRVRETHKLDFYYSSYVTV